MQDLHNGIAPTKAIKPQNVGAATVNGTGIDTKGYDSVEFIIQAGTAGETLCTTVKYTIYLEHSTDNATFSAVTNAYDVLGTMETQASGIVKILDASGDDDATYKIGYVGAYSKYRYVRVKVIGSNVSSNTIFSAVAVRGNPITEPTAELNG